MAMILKRSTAVDVLIGPFVDRTDGFTAETAESPSVQVSKNGQALAAKNDVTTPVHDANGYYNCELSATDTNSVGQLVLTVAASANALPVRHEFQVVDETTYNALFQSGPTAFDVSGRVDVGEWLGNAVTFGTGGPDVNVNAISDDTTAATNCEAFFDGTGYAGGTINLAVNAVQISGDTTAADNLELMYDGTGYTDATAPASRAQVDGIGAASGGSLNFAADTDNTGGAIKSVTFVGTQTGTFANTEAEDSTYHTIDDTTDEIDIVYQFDIGGGRTAVEVTFKGYLTGSNDTLNIQAYDFAGADWETRAVLTGQNGTANVTQTVPLLTKHTGTTGADLGLVLIRFQNTAQSNPQLNVDELLVAAVNIGQSVGYANGSVWLDTSASNTNTEPFVDGVADNPVSTIAAAFTVAASVGLKRITVAAGSSFTLGADSTNYEFIGDNYTLAFGGQTITGAKITGATVSGTFVGTTAILTNCIINAIAGPGITMRSCFFNEVTVTNNGTAGWYINDGRSRIAGTGRMTFDFGAAAGNTGLSVRSYSGGIELQNMGQAGTDTASIEGVGNLVLNANCVGGTLVRRGVWDYTDNSSGVAITFDELHDDTKAILADTGTDGVVISSATANQIADAILARANGVETGFTLQEAMRIVLSASAGKLSGAATTTVNIRDVGDSKNRISATVDADGNRSAVTLDAT